jgi:hypothetical protein
MTMTRLMRGVLSRAKMHSPGLSVGTQTSGTYYTRHTVAQTSFDLQMEFSNFYSSGGTETDGVNPITVKSSSVDQSGNIHPLYFRGHCRSRSSRAELSGLTRWAGLSSAARCGT